MKTAEKNANAVQGTAAKNNLTANQQITNRPSFTGKEAKANEKANDEIQEQAHSSEDGNNEAKVGGTVTVDNQPANAASSADGQGLSNEPNAETENTNTPQTHPDKSAEEKAKPMKFAFNLEQTLKSVEGLHRLSIQRIALLSRIKTLEDFEVKLIEENDELETNPYQGCKLIIKDDKGREFVTNTPNLIRMVSQFIFDACHDKLAEIEANIIFPNA